MSISSLKWNYFSASVSIKMLLPLILIGSCVFVIAYSYKNITKVRNGWQWLGNANAGKIYLTSKINRKIMNIGKQKPHQQINLSSVCPLVITMSWMFLLWKDVEKFPKLFSQNGLVFHRQKCKLQNNGWSTISDQKLVVWPGQIFFNQFFVIWIFWCSLTVLSCI